MHGYVLHNDDIIPVSTARLSLGQVGFMTGWGVFSTLRVTHGVLFAYDRHWRRMAKDAVDLRVPFPESADWLHDRLLRLVEKNQANEATLRVNIVRNRGGAFEGPDPGRAFDVIAFTANLNNWGEGVRLGVISEGRHAASKFAGTKVTSWAFNLNFYEEAHERGFDEVILLNERGEVSELTSANIFAVFGNDVVTPPLHSGCLAGITREILLNDIIAPPLVVSERTLHLHDLKQADEVFITSSTRDVLPVFEIEGATVNRKGDASHLLRHAFQEYIREWASSKAIAY